MSGAAAMLCGLAVTAAILLAMADPSRPAARLRRIGPGPAASDGTARIAPSGRAAVALAGAAVVVALLLPAASVWAVAAAAAGWLGRAARRATLRRRRVQARRGAVVDVVFALAAELRAGRPPMAALAAVAGSPGPLSDLLAGVARAAGTGASAADELRACASLPGCAALGAVAAAWSVTERVGGPVADVLDRVGQALDDDEQHRRAIDALLAGPRTTMLLLAALPLVGVALAHSLGAQPVRLLTGEPLGWALLAGATVLDVAGVLWTRALARAAERG